VRVIDKDSMSSNDSLQLPCRQEEGPVDSCIALLHHGAVSRLLNIVKERGGRFDEALRDSGGKPFWFDDGPMRYLHFDERFVQSAMCMEAPDELALGYTRAMMGFLLFQGKPRHILMVGLGGGSLVKYCHRHLPRVRITVLEIDADVIALRGQFMIPPDDERLQVIHCDAADYLARSRLGIDVLLLDGFTADGPAAELTSDQFFAHCRRLVNPHGIMVANLPRFDPSFAVHAARMHDEAGWQICGCQAADSNNAIIFAHKASGNRLLPRTLRKRAQRLVRHGSLELLELARHIHVNISYAGPEPLSPPNGQPDAANMVLARISEDIELLLDSISMYDGDALEKAVSLLEIDRDTPVGKLLQAVLAIASR
jgi:spermidine synthase